MSSSFPLTINARPIKEKLEEVSEFLDKYLNENTPESLNVAFHMCEVWAERILEENDYWLRREVICIIKPMVQEILDKYAENPEENLNRAFRLCKIWSRISNNAIGKDDYELQRAIIWMVGPWLEKKSEMYEDFTRSICLFFC